MRQRIVNPRILKYVFQLDIKILSDPELANILNEKAKRMTLEAATKHEPIVTLTTSDFDKYVNDGRPVFVDFWAVWCPPCRAMEPVVERLAAKYSGKVLFGKLNTDEQSEIATRYEIQSIPTFMVFKNGQPIDATIGAVGEVALDRLIQKSLNGSSAYR
jgi:thioredoxin 1